MNMGDQLGHCYAYPRPAVACTVLVKDKAGKLLLGKRKPSEDDGQEFRWSLPGGFLNEGRESALECVRRELKEETHLPFDPSAFNLFSQSSNPETDPRGHVVNLIWTVSLGGLGEAYGATPGDDLEALEWVEPGFYRCLAFDHWAIVCEARRRGFLS